MQSRRIGENEITIVRIIDNSLVRKVMAFEQHALDVGNVPVPDVGAEDRLKAQFHRIGARVEGAMDAGIVGLAAEKEILKDAREVVLLAHAAP